MPRLIMALSALTVLLGCGCGPRIDPPDRASAPPTEPRPAIEGRVLFRGIALPAPSAPPPCQPRPPLDLGEDGGLAGVLVHLEGLPGPAPTELELSGDGCVFTPRAAVVPRGTVLVVANDGAALQTVHLRRLDGGQEVSVQNLALPPGSGVLRYALDRAGRYRVRADARPWMEASIWVVEGGVGLVSDDDGRFALPVPPGTWTAALWHPALGLRREVTEVPPDGPASLYLTWSRSR